MSTTHAGFDDRSTSFMLRPLVSSRPDQHQRHLYADNDLSDLQSAIHASTLFSTDHFRGFGKDDGSSPIPHQLSTLIHHLSTPVAWAVFPNRHFSSVEPEQDISML
jgi:hypothetical protein